MPCSYKFLSRIPISRALGDLWDISALISPVAPFTFMILGSLRVKLLPSTSTNSSSSLAMVVFGIRSAYALGMIRCHRSVGSRKWESPELAQILSVMGSTYDGPQPVRRDRTRNAVPLLAIISQPI